MSDLYPLTSDDVGPRAKVGGEPPRRVWGSGVHLGTLWMVLRGWSKKNVACAVPLVCGLRRPTTPGPVSGHVCGMGEVGRTKKTSFHVTVGFALQIGQVLSPKRLVQSIWYQDMFLATIQP